MTKAGTTTVITRNPRNVLAPSSCPDPYPRFTSAKRRVGEEKRVTAQGGPESGTEARLAPVDLSAVDPDDARIRLPAAPHEGHRDRLALRDFQRRAALRARAHRVFHHCHRRTVPPFGQPVHGPPKR